MTGTLTVTDLFCGAGGSSIGAERAGARLVIAANHWERAVETHAANFPHAEHDVADISQVDPRRYPRTDILLASPECTTYSPARRRADPTDAVEADRIVRSRATMWDVPRFAERHRYEIVIVENVPDAATIWDPFPHWLGAMGSLGYEHRILSLNSFIAGVPQTRDRMYVVFHRRGNAAPDLDFPARAHCPHCDADVAGIQRFREGGPVAGRYGRAYDYACPECAARVEPYAMPAALAVDWGIAAKRIGERRMAETTMTRIRSVLERETRASLDASPGALGTRPGFYRTDPAWGDGLADARRAGFFLGGGFNYHRADGEGPLVSGTGHALTMPMATITTAQTQGLVMLPGGRARKPSIEDCTYRTWRPHEVGRAMAFPDDYALVGDQRDRVTLYGNAVTPPMMEAIVRRAAASLTGTGDLEIAA